MDASHKQSTGQICQKRSIATSTPMIILALLVYDGIGFFTKLSGPAVFL